MAGSDLVELACAAQRGVDRIASARRLRVQLRIRGNLLALRWRSPFTRPYEIEIDPRRPGLRMTPFHRPGRVGIFGGDRVAVEEDGREVRSRDRARAHARAHLVWDELDLLYFLGYALWNYVMTPAYFRWPELTTREIEPWRGLRRLEVTYPDGFPTHCKVQIYYFEADGQLVRLDYTAEIFSDRLRGAHLCEGHREIGGLVVPTHRVVFPMRTDLSPMRWAPAAMEGWIVDLAIEG